MNTYSDISLSTKLNIKGILHSSFPIIQTVIDGVQQGKIFMNGQQDFWVLHKSGFSEVFLNEDDGSELVDFVIKSEKLPKYFHLYDPPENLKQAFKFRSDIFNIFERDRIQLKYNGQLKQQKEKNSLFVLNEEFSFATVTQNNFECLSVFNLDLDNKFWDSKEEFLNNASGVFIKDKQNRPASLCYAAAIADQRGEIDVATIENQTGKGLAKSIVNFFVNECTKKGVIPNWDCFEDNTASLKVANHLKFIFNRKYKFISIFKMEKQ